MRLTSGVILCLCVACAPSSSDDVPDVIEGAESEVNPEDAATLSDSSRDAFFGSTDNIPVLANVSCYFRMGMMLLKHTRTYHVVAYCPFTRGIQLCATTFTLHLYVYRRSVLGVCNRGILNQGRACTPSCLSDRLWAPSQFRRCLCVALLPKLATVWVSAEVPKYIDTYIYSYIPVYILILTYIYIPIYIVGGNSGGGHFITL